MIKSLIISLFLAISIELFSSIVIGVRNRNDILTIVAVNSLTNPIVVFIANILNSCVGSLLYWAIIIVIEIIVIFAEGKIYNKILTFRKVTSLKLSIINNVVSFGIGIIINLCIDIL